jgi:hypothetical protein
MVKSITFLQSARLYFVMRVFNFPGAGGLEGTVRGVQ